MKIKKNNDAISEMLGSILLLLIAVTSFIVIHANILFNPFPDDQTYITIVGEIKGKNITLLHRGGESLSMQTKAIFEIGENTFNIIIGENDYLNSEFKADGLWNIGESLIFKQANDLDDLKVKVTIIDVKTNCVVMSKIL